MFILTAKLTRKKLIACVLVGALLLSGLIVLAAKGGDVEASTPSISYTGIASNNDRIQFVSQFGWRVSEMPAESQEVLIPKNFDDVLQQYNELQMKQGLDLKKYAGKRVMRYSYRIENYGENQSDVFIDMFVYKGKVIGGDIHSTALDGFMHGFAKEGSTLAEGEDDLEMGPQNDTALAPSTCCCAIECACTQCPCKTTPSPGPGTPGIVPDESGAQEVFDAGDPASEGENASAENTAAQETWGVLEHEGDPESTSGNATVMYGEGLE